MCTKRSQGSRDSWKNWSQGSDFHASVTRKAERAQMIDGVMCGAQFRSTAPRGETVSSSEGHHSVALKKKNNKNKKPRCGKKWTY